MMEHISVLSTFRDQGWVDKTIQLGEICTELKISPINSLMVGDVVGDIVSASQAGFGLTVGVLTGEFGFDELQASQPDAILAHVGELPYLLDQYNHDPHSVKGRGGLFSRR